MTSISLVKGQGISLTKAAPSTRKFYIAAGWHQLNNGDKDVDVDVAALLCKTASDGNPYLYPYPNGATDSEVSYGNLVFFNNTGSRDGAVNHSGDNLTGRNNPALRGTAAEEDDEAVTIDIDKLDPEVDEIALILTIDKAAERRHSFGKITDCFIRITKEGPTGDEIASYKPGEDFKTFTAVNIGSLVKKNGEWEFVSVGEGAVMTFPEIVGQYMKG